MSPTQTLADTRSGLTHRFVIHAADGDYRGYISTGLFADGTVGEIFLKMDRQGRTVSGFCDAWAVAVSLLLQSGTPLEEICRKFRAVRFEPAGRTDTKGIPVALSPIDYVCRWLEARYLTAQDAAAPRAEAPAPARTAAPAVPEAIPETPGRSEDQAAPASLQRAEPPTRFAL